MRSSPVKAPQAFRQAFFCHWLLIGRREVDEPAFLEQQLGLQGLSCSFRAIL
jgi:hypothetical protein